MLKRLDLAELEQGDIIFAQIPRGWEDDFTFPHPFTLLDPGMAYMRFTGELPTFDGFPLGTRLSIAREVGVVTE